jgi:hypothetical protein
MCQVEAGRASRVWDMVPGDLQRPVHAASGVVWRPAQAGGRPWLVSDRAWPRPIDSLCHITAPHRPQVRRAYPPHYQLILPGSRPRAARRTDQVTAGVLISAGNGIISEQATWNGLHAGWRSIETGLSSHIGAPTLAGGTARSMSVTATNGLWPQKCDFRSPLSSPIGGKR